MEWPVLTFRVIVAIFTFVFWSKTRKDQLIPTPKVYHDGFKGRNPWFILGFFGLSRELTKRFLTKQDEQ